MNAVATSSDLDLWALEGLVCPTYYRVTYAYIDLEAAGAVATGAACCDDTAQVGAMVRCLLRDDGVLHETIEIVCVENTYENAVGTRSTYSKKSVDEVRHA